MENNRNGNTRNHCLEKRTVANGGRARQGAPLAFLKAQLGTSKTSCTLWPFGKMGFGYGQIWFMGAKVPAHKAMCVLAHGEKPFSAAQVAHSCGVRLCVNPNHLRWATPKENALDKWNHGTVKDCDKCFHAKLTVAQVRSIYLDRRTLDAIAAEHRCSIETVSLIQLGRSWRRVTADLGAPRNRQRVGRERGHKLTPADARSIYQDIRHHREVAAAWEIHFQTVLRIWQRKIWRHATGDLPSR